MAISSFTRSGLSRVTDTKLPQAGTWAVVSDTPTGTYSDGDGTWDYWRITASGSLNVSIAGLLDVLIVGGGGGGGAGSTGGPGSITTGIRYVSSGSNSITIGAGGSGRNTSGLPGSNTTFSGVVSAAGFGGLTYPVTTDAATRPSGTLMNALGTTTSITGSSVTYGVANLSQYTPGGNNTGNGGGSGAAGGAAGGSGGSGVVVVRRPQA